MAVDNIKGAAHVGLYVKDIEVTKKFYCDILGFECIFEKIENSPDGVICVSFLQRGDLMLEVINVPGITINREGCFRHIALRVINIEEAIEKLHAFGIQTEDLVISPHTLPGGSKWANFTGPDGEHLELNEVGTI